MDSVTAPVSPGERLHTLDILRGFALFGMILVHFHQYMRIEVDGLEGLIGWGVYILVEQKAWGTFAFLFGVGFAVLLRRLHARHASVVTIYLRRLAALALFGIVAEVFFGFHILFEYAVLGLVLLLVCRWPTWLLCVTAFAAAGARTLLFQMVSAGVLNSAGFAATRALRQAASAAASQPDYGALLSARWALFVGTLNWHDLVPGTNLTLFIIGVLAIRHGILDDPRRHVTGIAGWIACGVAAWAGAWLLVPHLGQPVTLISRVVLSGVTGTLQDQWLCFAYIGALVLLLAFRPVLIPRLALVGDAGRMALTNYMVQVVVLDLLASGYGFGLKLRPAPYAVAAVLLFTAQALFSRAWLARYRFGPLEWLWRTVTYAQPQQLTRDVVPAIAGA